MLLSEKRQRLRAHQNDPTSSTKKDAFGCTRRKVRELREMHDLWYSKQAEEIQEYSDSDETK